MIVNSKSATYRSPKQTAHPSKNGSRTKGHEPQSSTFVENPLQIAPFMYKRTQSCPPPADSKPFIPQRVTTMKPPLGPMKTNPNEPKRSQNKPNFSPVRGPQSQNKPKQTQSVVSLSNLFLALQWQIDNRMLFTQEAGSEPRTDDFSAGKREVAESASS